MVRKRVVVKNPTGLHLRPAGLLCENAMKYTSMITLQFCDYTTNAKSLLGILGACIKAGDEIEFICEGEDEEEALAKLIQLVEDGLGEKR